MITGQIDCADPDLKALLTQLLIQPPPDVLELTICSSGGDDASALALLSALDRLRLYGTHVRTIGIGTVSSAATYLLFAGDERLVAPTISVCLHLGHTRFDNATVPHREVMTWAKHLQDICNTYASFLAEHSNRGAAFWTHFLADGQDHWLGAADLERYRLIDGYWPGPFLAPR